MDILVIKKIKRLKLYKIKNSSTNLIIYQKRKKKKKKGEREKRSPIGFKQDKFNKAQLTYKRSKDNIPTSQWGNRLKTYKYVWNCTLLQWVTCLHCPNVGP